jgi:hypothetical protein
MGKGTSATDECIACDRINLIPERKAMMSRKTTEELTRAFRADGFEVENVITYQGARGILAMHRTAVTYETKKPKQAIYTEGTSYQMGYLIGQLVPEDVRRMSTDFVENIVPAFISEHTTPDEHKFIKEVFACIVVDYCHYIYTAHPDLPISLLHEMQGLVDGCKAAGVRVDYHAILALNAGVDCLLSLIYSMADLEAFREEKGTSPRVLAEHLPGLVVRPSHAESLAKIRREHLRIPISCNAFAVFGDLTEGGSHFFGRDFMFPTADVFQFCACPIIYNPDTEDGTPQFPLVSMAAPGLFGSIAAMNAEKIGMGVDMVPAVLCDFKRPGLNSLLMVRHCIQESSSAEQAVDLIANAQRGVSWLYPIADGKNNRAAFVEACRTMTEPIDYRSYPPGEIKGLLPSATEFQKDRNGIMVRWNGYHYPEVFLKCNRALFRHFKKPYHKGFFAPCGYLDRTWKGAANPESFYFAPQRESLDGLIVITNAFITPEMRMVAMQPWSNELTNPHQGDIQWRFDELTHELLEALSVCGKSGPGKISFSRAREIIDFLNPGGKFPTYYANNPESSDGKALVIEGSVSLFDLTHLKMTSHYGYYPDEWVTIDLAAYTGKSQLNTNEPEVQQISPRFKKRKNSAKKKTAGKSTKSRGN